MVSTEQRGQRLARQLTLRDERARRALREPPPVGTCGVAGSQDDSGRVTRLAEPRSHLEPVDTGKLNIKQDKLRPQPRRLGDSRLTISGLAHDLDPIRLKQLADNLPETLMVIDDQDGERHQISVASPPTARTRANPCSARPQGAQNRVLCVPSSKRLLRNRLTA